MDLFKAPKLTAPPRPPTIDDARQNLDTRKTLAARQGRASNIITGGMSTSTGDAAKPATKILLGQ